ncbi:MAG TPA: aldehyde dehydrogenase family protein [Solirubrobacteraceae bacterium]|nr:aldehyde dehydrogenase family protein [Solirubrobacteraceae bacterium]
MSGTTFDAVDPATQRAFAQIPESPPEAIAEAVASAHDALEREREWRTPERRAGALQAIARAIEAEGPELARLECLDTGKPLAQAHADVRTTVRYFEYYAGAADKILGTSIPLGPDHVDYTVREPWGVCGQIIPWNYPMQVLARCAAPALAAGNAVVLKPSELGSVTPMRIAELALAAGLPAGLFAVATGHGATGAALVAHAGVDHVTFVGSAAVGRLVAHACAERLAPLQLELGGKSPNIVFADGDLERAAPVIVRSLIQNAGQSCSAGTRLLVESGRRDELLERIATLMAALRIGPGIDDPDLGPLISQAQIERAEGMLARAREDGAAVLLGGDRPRDRDGEWYLEPTILTAVEPGMEIFEEEVFGPVLAVTAFEGEAEAVALANATPYGLVAGVWTADIARAHRVASAVRAGQVYVNGYGVAGGVELPFGGMKGSGYGRGKGLEALHTYTQLKNVCVTL